MKGIVAVKVSAVMAVWIGLFNTMSAQTSVLDNSLLWKIEKEGHEDSYLFGTIHMLPQEDFEMKPKVEKAFSESEILVMELDITNPNMQMEIMKHAQMSDGSTIDQFLSPSEFADLDSLLKETVGAGLGMFKTMKPFMVSTFLLSRYVGSQPASFEMQFAMKAGKDSIPILGLETIAEQMAVFDSISYEVQAEGLVEMIEEEEKMKELYSELVERYKKEELSALSTLLQEEMDGEGEAEFLLDIRNENWIERISAITNEQSAFIAVGAGHLAGDKGVIELLRAEGFTVTAVLE